ncbi:MAG: pyridoxine 5'-phosphate synthase [Deltaproteobacteria bacterium]|nr:MAG: pyridoxine 5'-phosphate synthase [Deltaproteobacteria bacterium]
MIRLSVNVNKVATLRNSRGGDRPDPVEAARVAVEAGAHGITVHPREDRRHIRPDDVERLADFLAPLREQVEFNIEGDPRPELRRTWTRVRPHQATLVPVRPGEITSSAGWPPSTDTSMMREIVAELSECGIRTSLFVEPDPAAIEWAAEVGADRVELYTEPYARAFEAGGEALEESLARYVSAASLAHRVGLGVNAGHDLDRANLVRFRKVPHLAEVSIGHALVSDALYLGLANAVRAYLDVLRPS